MLQNIKICNNKPGMAAGGLCKDDVFFILFPSPLSTWSHWSLRLTMCIFHTTSCLSPFIVGVTKERQLIDMESRNTVGVQTPWASFQLFSCTIWGRGHWSIHFWLCVCVCIFSWIRNHSCAAAYTYKYHYIRCCGSEKRDLIPLSRFPCRQQSSRQHAMSSNLLATAFICSNVFHTFNFFFFSFFPSSL